MYRDRYPRTLHEAFGPYAKLDVPHEPAPLLQRITGGLYVAASVGGLLYAAWVSFGSKVFG